MKTYGVIMAGGGGTRFWPLSRKARPKQFLNLTGKNILVNETIDRLNQVVEPKDIFVVTNISQAELTLTETNGRVAKDHILAEPAARNTAACIGYAAMEIVKKYGDGIMCVLPSDAYIRDDVAYQDTIRKAVQTAEETDGLVTIGITPTFPSTGYGYIKKKKEAQAAEMTGSCEVEEFVEKPDLETAQAYLAEGSYLWNSGMFIWKASTILRKFEALLPDIYACLVQIGEAMGTEQEMDTIAKVYPTIPKISVDYGIMERSNDVWVVEGDFGWNDVGSYDALNVLCPPDEQENLRYGECLLLDTKNSICYAKDKLIATVGVENLIVVATQDAVLVCPRDRAQEVKSITEELEKTGKIEFL